MKIITLTPKQLIDLLSEDDVVGFEGWSATADHESGMYDGEKGAMYDYKINLLSPTGEIYIARDGYYTGPTGDIFYGDIEFTLKNKKSKNTLLSEDQIKDKLEKIISKSDIKTVKKIINKL